MGEKVSKDQVHMRFLECLEQVNQAIQGTDDFQLMMGNVLDAILSIFGCDRAFLHYPCDPDAASWRIPMERTKAEYPGALAANLEIPMTAEVAETLRFLLDTDGPVSFGPESEHKSAPEINDRFNIKSCLCMAIHPKVGEPWQFGIHQCSHARIWTPSDRELFKLIGHRIADGLSVMLSCQKLSETPTFLDDIFENIPNMVFVKDAKDLRYVRLNKAGEAFLGFSQQELLGKNDYDFFPKEEADFFTAKDREVLSRRKLVDIPEETVHTKSGAKLLHTKKIPLLDNNGNPVYLLGIAEDITERKRINEALQSSEERLLLAAEAAQMGLWDWNIVTGDVIWSDQCKAHYGFGPETSMSYDLFLQALHPDDRDRVDAALKRAVEERTRYNDTKRTIWPDGSLHWTNSRAQVHCDAAGKPVRMIGVTFDMTEHKQMEQALIKREREFRTLAENSPDYIARYDTNCRTVYVNPTLEKFIGGPSSEIIGTTPTERASIPEFREYQRMIVEVLQSGKAAETDMLISDAGEGVRFFNVRFVAERGADAAITGVLAIGRDITERKRADEELQRLRNYLSNIIDSMPSVLVGVDGDGKVIQWNRRAEQVTGVSVENAHSRPLDEVFPRLKDEMQRIQKAIQYRQVLTDLKVPRKHQDETRYEDVTIYPVVANGVEGAVIRVDDVTERVRLEEMMIQSEKMLSVGGLAAGMAHEINNPLAGILHSASVLISRLTGDLPANHKAAEAAGTSIAAIHQYLGLRKLHDMLENIHTSANRAADIVKNMLSFARKSENVHSSHHLGSLLDQTLDLLKTDYDMKKHYDFKQIAIVRQYDNKAGPVSCEGSKIQQVFMNILKNGAEAMAEAREGQEQPKFILRIKDEGDWLRVEIEDNGTGMDAKTRRRIFEPFFTTKPKGKGTGLGLSVSYFIVTEDHGGEMDVHAAEEGGTCFVIRLPKTGKSV
jgi:PAS domain S-box-containing protein